VRSFVVIGGESGLGAATKARLVAGGDRVISVDVRGTPDVTADLGTSDGRRAAVAAITDASGGRLDGAVTFAGVAGRTFRSPREVVSVNYFGTVQILEGLRPLLAAGAAPAAVAISSNAATTTPLVAAELVDALLAGDEEHARELAGAGEHFAAYPSSKLAVARWVRRQATTPAWIGAGITLNAIAPGYIDTPMTAEGRADPNIGPLIDSFPMPVGRPGRPEEVAAMAAFLLGPDARFACGSVVFVDGGVDAYLRSDDWPFPLRTG
jgi:NAD(P)-dependent dehydrogenase (short-subunit alcohol dehydrogenase family)